MGIRVARPANLGGLVIGLASLLPVTPASAAKSAPVCPSFTTATFHHPTRIDNPYFPLAPGTRFTYRGDIKKEPEVDVAYVTHNTPTIDGIRPAEVLDSVCVAGN